LSIFTSSKLKTADRALGKKGNSIRNRGREEETKGKGRKEIESKGWARINK
jgi:hypothetical protein